LLGQGRVAYEVEAHRLYRSQPFAAAHSIQGAFQTVCGVYVVAAGIS
jgi:hypothetical protein